MNRFELSCWRKKEMNSISGRSSKLKAFLVSKSAAGRSCDIEVLLLVDLTIDGSFEVKAL